MNDYLFYVSMCLKYLKFHGVPLKPGSAEEIVEQARNLAVIRGDVLDDVIGAPR